MNAIPSNIDIPLRPLRRMRPAMGTFCSIELFGLEPGHAFDAIDAAFAQVERVATLMHPKRENSDIAAINAAGVGDSVRADETTWEVLVLARQCWEASRGVFDPCLPTREGQFGDLELRGEREVRCQAPLELDLGGIAKGYAVDLAVKTLLAAGCHEGVVNVGGDLRAFGTGSHPIAIRHANGYLEPFELRERAIAASALENANRPEEHRGYYTRAEGAPLATFATVVAPSAAIADALTKCALYCEPEEMDRVAKTFDAQWSRGR